MRFILSIRTALIILLGLGTLLVYYFFEERSTQEITIVIKSGSSIYQIASQLQEKGLLGKHEFPFVMAARLQALNGNYLQTGEYKFEPGSTVKSVLTKILEGDRVIRKITIPEGFTVHQVLEEVGQAEGLTGKLSIKPKEGWLLPETYLYNLDDTKDSIVQRMQEAMLELMEEEWEKRPADYPLKSKEEAIILASIIERETKIDAERTTVASVYLNRLARGMLLQADPTVVYAVSKGTAEFGRKVRYKDLKIESKYNTYKYKGLPPGPIANPGKASVIAALNPAKTNYIYFVADGEGGHLFAANVKQHKKNVVKYKQSEYYRINK